MNEEQRKWEFLRESPKRDAKTPEIISLARPLLDVASRSPWASWAFANLALALARDCVLYELDSDRVSREQIDGYTDPQGLADASYTRGIDDCDGKARFFVAICLAGSLDAEMVPRWRGERLAHVYGRVSCAGPRDRGAQWYLAETILRRARLGDVAEAVPKELETGKWLF
jgi:transglutaminase-like putative cysteine protease